MPDKISRKRHKKKVLDRWENEGGALPPPYQVKPIENALAEECSSAKGEPRSKDKSAAGKPEVRPDETV